jgi:hypothetical protein
MLVPSEIEGLRAAERTTNPRSARTKVRAYHDTKKSSRNGAMRIDISLTRRP